MRYTEAGFRQFFLITQIKYLHVIWKIGQYNTSRQCRRHVELLGNLECWSPPYSLVANMMSTKLNYSYLKGLFAAIYSKVHFYLTFFSENTWKLFVSKFINISMSFNNRCKYSFFSRCLVSSLLWTLVYIERN